MPYMMRVIKLYFLLREGYLTGIDWEEVTSNQLKFGVLDTTAWFLENQMQIFT